MFFIERVERNAMRRHPAFAAALATAIFCALWLSSCADLFQPRVSMDNSIKADSISNFVTPPQKITALSAPSELRVSNEKTGAYRDSVLLSWEKVEGAQSYYIECAEVGQSPDGSFSIYEKNAEGEPIVDGAGEKVLSIEFKRLDVVYGSTCYEHAVLDSADSLSSYERDEYSRRYYYRVKAMNELLGYEDSEFTPTDEGVYGALLPPPKNVTATKGESTEGITARWDKVPGAVAYRVWRTDRADGTGAECVQTMRDNKYFNVVTMESDQQKEFYFMVTAMTASGAESVKSARAMGFSLKAGAPTPPSSVTVEDGLGTSPDTLNVKWTQGGGIMEDDGVTYQIRRYRQLADGSVTDESVGGSIPGKSGDSPLAEIQYTDTKGLKIGSLYYYSVQTVVSRKKTDESGEMEELRSAFSATGPDSKSPALGFVISAPQAVTTADAEGGKITVKWTPAAGHDKLGDGKFVYNVYGADGIDGPFSILAGAEDVDATPGEDGYIGMAVEKKGYYCVKTVNHTEDPVKHLPRTVESKQSEIVAPMPNAPEGVAASKCAKFDGAGGVEWAPNKNGIYPVKVTWRKPSNDTPAGYNVYRSTRPDSGWSKLTDEPLPADALSYIDKNDGAKPRVFYYYKIASVNSLGQGSKSNIPADETSAIPQKRPSCGYGAITKRAWFKEYNQFINKHLKLMYKTPDTKKLGTEEPYADVHGTIYYKASLAGLGAHIDIQYRNYCDQYCVKGDSSSGSYFILNGNTNSDCNMSSNGMMSDTVVINGMYPARVNYDDLEVKGGNAGGGCYHIQLYDSSVSDSYNVKDGTGGLTKSNWNSAEMSAHVVVSQDDFADQTKESDPNPKLCSWQWSRF